MKIYKLIADPIDFKNDIDAHEAKSIKATKWCVSAGENGCGYRFLVITENKEDARRAITDLGVKVNSVRDVTGLKKYNY